MSVSSSVALMGRQIRCWLGGERA